MTIVIQIGNSDNRLTQGNWANFAASMHQTISTNVREIHFRGGSDWDAPWQNACWVCDVDPANLDRFKIEITACRNNFAQHSAAILVGQTEFI